MSKRLLTRRRMLLGLGLLGQPVARSGAASGLAAQASTGARPVTYPGPAPAPVSVPAAPWSASAVQAGGLHLALHTDRRRYTLPQDLINLGFTVHNPGPEPVELLLAHSGEPRTRVRALDARGLWHELPEPARLSSATNRWFVVVAPGDKAEFRQVVDPLLMGLGPGATLVEAQLYLGAARKQPSLSARASGIVLTAASNPRPTPPAPAGDAAALADSQGLTLSLHSASGHWRPGDPPLEFAAVCHLHAQAPSELWLLSLLSPTYCRLRVAGPGGQAFEIWPRQVPPASLSPHWRLAALAPGRSLGQELLWAPGGMAPGRYTLRAYYAVDQQAEARHAYAYAKPVLLSNAVTVEVGGARLK